MIEETAEIQTRAEESKNLMKSVINAKNSQLESAVKQLHDMKAIHGQLVEESKILTGFVNFHIFYIFLLAL